MALDKQGLSLHGRAGKSHPAPVHRALLLNEAFLQGMVSAFNLSEPDVRDFLDEVWVELAEVARDFGMPKNRWWGERTDRMGLASFARVRSGFWRYFNGRNENWKSVLAGNV